MNIVKSFSRRSFAWLLVLMLVFVAIVDISIYLGAKYILTLVPPDQLKAAAAEVPELEEAIGRIWPVMQWSRVLFLPASIAFCFLFFLLFWAAVRKILVNTLKREGFEPKTASGKDAARQVKKKKTSGPKKPDFRQKPFFDPDEPEMSKNKIQDLHQRYYLHLLAVLQREGRLVDFLKEDLEPYEDAQIGSAVRSIQENCKKSIEKHLSPNMVMEKSEGEEITVFPDFDPSAIKLTGNITGEPPFTGIIRHRGWRAGKLELPVLSGSGDPKIITPAEIEVF